MISFVGNVVLTVAHSKYSKLAVIDENVLNHFT